MKRIIVIMLSLLMVSCIPIIKKQIIPTEEVVAPKIIKDKEVSIKVKVKSNGESLEDAASELNNIYGLPTVEINAFCDEDGKIIIMKKLYYDVSEKIFIVVSIVNDQVLFIDTVHSPR